MGKTLLSEYLELKNSSYSKVNLERVEASRQIKIDNSSYSEAHIGTIGVPYFNATLSSHAQFKANSGNITLEAYVSGSGYASMHLPCILCPFKSDLSSHASLKINGKLSGNLIYSGSGYSSLVIVDVCNETTSIADLSSHASCSFNQSQIQNLKANTSGYSSFKFGSAQNAKLNASSHSEITGQQVLGELSKDKSGYASINIRNRTS